MSECTREPEVLQSVMAGRWPDACGDELRAHVASCATCAELATVAGAIAEDAAAAMRSAPVPSSGLVWWRMQRRMQTAAARNAKRTVTFVETATLTASFFAVLFVLGGLSAFRFDWSVLASWNVSLLLPFAGAALLLLVIAPVALYAAVGRE